MRSIAAVLAAVVVLAAGRPAAAQEGFRAGVVGDFNLARQSVRPEPSHLELRRYRTWGAGLVLQWPLGARASLALEPSLLHRGGVTDVPAESGRVVTRLRYVELPLRVRVTLAGSGAVRPYVALGPSVAWLQSARGRVTGPGLDTVVDATDEARRFDIAASGGAGLAFGEHGRSAFVEALYTHGFGNLDKTNEVQSRNRGVQLRLGLLFGGR